MDIKDQVLYFMEKFQPDMIANFPNHPTASETNNPEMWNFRHEFLKEEYEEYLEAVEAKDETEILDALIDICWVAIGTAYMRFGPAVTTKAMNEVFRSNIEGKFKLDGNPKIQKGADWKPPAIADVIKNNQYVPSDASGYLQDMYMEHAYYRFMFNEGLMHKLGDNGKFYIKNSLEKQQSGMPYNKAWGIKE